MVMEVIDSDGDSKVEVIHDYIVIDSNDKAKIKMITDHINIRGSIPEKEVQKVVLTAPVKARCFDLHNAIEEKTPEYTDTTENITGFELKNSKYAVDQISLTKQLKNEMDKVASEPMDKLSYESEERIVLDVEDSDDEAEMEMVPDHINVSNSEFRNTKHTIQTLEDEESKNEIEKVVNKRLSKIKIDLEDQLTATSKNELKDTIESNNETFQSIKTKSSIPTSCSYLEEDYKRPTVRK